MSRRNTTPKGKSPDKPIKGVEETMERGMDKGSDDKGRRVEATFGSPNYKGKPKSQSKRNYKGSGYNDPSWYAKSTRLLNDAASLAFANFQGVTIHDTGNGGTDFKPEGVMGIEYIPTFGSASLPTDALNIAIRNVYSFVRHANSGHTNYESADLGIYLLGIIECYSAIADLERIYGISRVYSIKNRNLPRTLLAAMKVDADDVLLNQATLRYGINRLIIKLQSLCIPKGFSLLERRIWMNSYIFKDANTDKASLYVFVPKGFYKYYADLSSKGGGLAYADYTTNRKVSRLLGDAESMIDAILEDEDMNIMSGDILKAYGDSGLVSLGTLPEDYALAPVYQPEVLPQIHNMTAMYGFERFYIGSTLYHNTTYNATVIPMYPTSPNYHGSLAIMVQQNGGVLDTRLYIGNKNHCAANAPGIVSDYVPYFEYGTSGGNRVWPNRPAFAIGKVLLDLPDDDASPEKVMVATRLHASVRLTSGSDEGETVQNETVQLAYVGTEIVWRTYMFQANVTVFANSSPMDGTVGHIISVGGVPTPIDNAVIGGALEYPQYDMSPLLYVRINSGDGKASQATFTFDYVVGDLYNFTTITENELKKLHDTAVISEFTLPGAIFNAD